jgi:hypothetical protein
MTADLVVLSQSVPDSAAILTTLAAVAPELRVDTSIESVLQLRDEHGRLVVSVEAPSTIAVAGEAERLLGCSAPSASSAPYFWTELRSIQRPGVAAVLAQSLAAQFLGIVSDGIAPSQTAAPEATTASNS